MGSGNPSVICICEIAATYTYFNCLRGSKEFPYCAFELLYVGAFPQILPIMLQFKENSTFVYCIHTQNNFN